MELQYSVSTWFTFIVGIIILCFIYLNRKFQYWNRQGIPSPTNNLWSVLKEMYRFKSMTMQELQMKNYQKFGRIHGFFLGFKRHLVVGEPHIIRNILIKDFDTFHNRMRLKTGTPLFDSMLTSLEDDDWKRIRCIMSPTFTSSRMRKMAYMINECAEKFSENMKKIVESNENQSIDCKKYLNSFTIDVIASTAFGTKLSSLDDPENEFVKRSRQATSSDISVLLVFFLLFPGIVRWLGIDVFGGKFNFFKDFISQVTERREKEKTKGNDFLQLIMDAQRGVLEISTEDAKEEQANFKILPKHKTMNSDEMMAQCTLFLFAGNETTTNTLAFVLYYMALNPNLQDTLIDEIDEVWKTEKEMNFDVLNKMQYLNAVINETLRKEPIAIQILRESTEEYEISEIGLKIPKGTLIVVPVYAMHRDSEFFPNAQKFDPERFMPENRSLIPPYVYLPFGEGPRNCIGMRFAIMVLKMCLAHFFKHFRVYATEETRKPLEYYNGQGLIQPKKIMVQLAKRR